MFFSYLSIIFPQHSLYLNIPVWLTFHSLTSYCFCCSRDLVIHLSLFLSDSCVHCLPRLSLISLVVAWCQTKNIKSCIMQGCILYIVYVVVLIPTLTSGRVLRKAFFSWLYHSCWGVLGFSGTFEPFFVILSTRSGCSSLPIHIMNQHLSTILILKYAAGAGLIFHNNGTNKKSHLNFIMLFTNDSLSLRKSSTYFFCRKEKNVLNRTKYYQGQI